MKNTYKYLLVPALGCILFSGNIIAEDEPSTDAIKVSKSIIPTDADKGEYKIHLETYVTGSSVTKVTETTKPVDIVLVLDTSNSMTDNSVPGESWLSAGQHDITYSNYRSNFLPSSKEYNATSSNNGGTGWILYDGQYYRLNRETGTARINGGSRTVYRVYIDINGDQTGGKLYLDGAGFTETPPANQTSTSGTIATRTIYQKVTKTRLLVLKEAVSAFLDTVEENAKGKDGQAGTEATNSDNVAHRVSIVAFDQREYYMTGSSSTNHQTDNNYSDNFVNILNADGSSNTDNLKAIVNSLDVHSYTRHDRGMLAANNILAAIPEARDTISSKVVLLFTDGNACYDSPNLNDGVDRHSMVVKKAVEYAYIAKSGKTSGNTAPEYDKANVFTVTLGLGEDATDPTVKYMKYVSSNYPNVTSANATYKNDTGGWRDQVMQSSSPVPTNAEEIVGANFCFSTDSGSGLERIFVAIASSATQGGETYPLDANTTSVIDVVSDNFLIPANVEVTIWHESCYGVDEDGNYLWAKSDDTDHYYSNGGEAHLDPNNTDPQKVKVVGFDYAAEDEWNKDGTPKTLGNWVGARKDADDNIIGYWGNKVVIEFPIKVNPDYEGGYSMPSNDITSGVYVGDTNVKPYPVPVVDFPSICIMKEGMAIGETALFDVTGPKNVHYTLSLTQRANAQGDKLPCYVILKRLDGGVYTVTEKNWTWLYNTTPSSKYISQAVISAEMMNVTVEDILDEGKVIKNNGTEVGMTLERETKIYGGSEQGTYQHTFIVLADKDGEYDSYELDDLKGSAISLLYYFSNTRATEGKAARAESYAHNVFSGGKTTGGTETGGNEEEDM